MPACFTLKLAVCILTTILCRVMCGLIAHVCLLGNSWFQTFAVLWIFFILGDSPGDWIWCADVSVGGADKKTRPVKVEQSVPKRQHIKFRRRGITQKKKMQYLVLVLIISVQYLCLVSNCSICALYQTAVSVPCIKLQYPCLVSNCSIRALYQTSLRTDASPWQ
jgi:hypothetical protein